MKTRQWTAATLAALSLVAVASSPTFAQDKMKPAPKMQSKMGQTVYACKMCKMYFPEADAKKMKMMDPMGHKMAKMDVATAKKMGYKMGGGKMMPHGHGKM